MEYTTKDMLASLNASMHDDRVTSEQMARANDFKKSLDDFSEESKRIAKEKADKLKKAQESGNFTKSMSEDEKKIFLESVKSHLHSDELNIDPATAERVAEERKSLDKLLGIQLDRKEQTLKKLELAKTEGDPEKIAEVMAECDIVDKNIIAFSKRLKALE